MPKNPAGDAPATPLYWPQRGPGTVGLSTGTRYRIAEDGQILSEDGQAATPTADEQAELAAVGVSATAPPAPGTPPS